MIRQFIVPLLALLLTGMALPAAAQDTAKPAVAHTPAMIRRYEGLYQQANNFLSFLSLTRASFLPGRRILPSTFIGTEKVR